MILIKLIEPLKQYLKQGYIFLLFLCAVSVLLNACHPVNEDKNPVYGIMVFDSIQDIDTFIPAMSLKTGAPRARGMDLPPNAVVITTWGQYYFVMHTDTKTFVRYRATQQGFVKEQELGVKGIPYEAYSSWLVWVNPHTILLGSTENEHFSYMEIDLRAMKILRHGPLEVPAAPADLKYTAISARFANNKLYLFYTFQKGLMRQHIYPPDSAVYAEIFNYPQLQTKKSLKDSRTTWPGGYNIWGPNTLVFKDTVYVLGQPGKRTGDHPSAFPAILRIDSKKDVFDPDYLFRLDSNKTREAYTLHDLGHGLAITKVIEKKKINKFMDYSDNRSAHFELLDLVKKTNTRLITENINISFWQDVLLEGDNAYLAAYYGNNKSQIWIYNLKTGNLKPGIKVEGTVFRLEKLSSF